DIRDRGAGEGGRGYGEVGRVDAGNALAEGDGKVDRGCGRRIGAGLDDRLHRRGGFVDRIDIAGGEARRQRVAGNIINGCGSAADVEPDRAVAASRVHGDGIRTAAGDAGDAGARDAGCRRGEVGGADVEHRLAEGDGELHTCGVA